ncbi:hypothetical protein AMK09_37635 [Streptomyces sp. CB02488]|uniref:hypothetical protein n=1 Tax=Streptomyces sp. CB02488 TaxID=1703920 RepID=UPI00093A23CA|nr:hypothetical protein [Streptomyces sp. CB02488]OKK05281.1 hypothetical protein AMK09_37635 [Streptomyces sp. CB02488]
MHYIRAARTAQHRAVRALAVRGLAHPLTHLLLAAAATAAAQAWDAGHRVTELHPVRTDRLQDSYLIHLRAKKGTP